MALPAKAQTADGEFTASFNGTTLELTMRLQGNPVHELATSTLRFTYNTAGLSFPASPVSGTDYSYLAYNGFTPPDAFYTSTVTNNEVSPGVWEVSVNIVLGSFPNGVDLPSSWTPVVTLYFDILNSVETSNIQWTLKEVFKVTNPGVDPYSVGTFADFDIPLDASLPVELESFLATADGRDVVLQWSPSAEIGTDYEIQTRSDNEGWRSIGTVAPSNSDSYSYRASGLAVGEHSFRIAIRSADGSVTYSTEVEASIGLGADFEIGDVFPNPFGERGSLSFSVRESQPVSVDVYNLLGQRVQSVFAQQVTANQTETVRLDGSTLSNGTYFVRVQGSDFVATRTISVLR
jgi:hypothetical protein